MRVVIRCRSMDKTNPDAKAQQSRLQTALSEAITEIRLVKQNVLSY